MLRQTAVIEDLQYCKPFFQTLTQESAFIVLGSHTLFSNSQLGKLKVTQEREVGGRRQFLSTDQGVAFLDLSFHTRRQNDFATIQLAGDMASWQHLNEIRGFVVTIDLQNQDNFLNQIAKDLALLFKYDPKMLQHCIFAFTGFPPERTNQHLLENLALQKNNVKKLLVASEYMREKNSRARDSGAEYFQELIEITDQDKQNQFLFCMLEYCYENCHVIRYNDETTVDHFFSDLKTIPSVAKQDLAVGEYCKTHYPMGDYAMAEEIQPVIASWCDPSLKDETLNGNALIRQDGASAFGLFSKPKETSQDEAWVASEIERLLQSISNKRNNN